ncbi:MULTISPECIES: CoA ester lyase [unclassified Beijerinckia]|uniref:HpcH/HpaI aldolase/citrate lyase family protein n=1 Tax=unclassified Beijerinckia TaxID=2638183 RepID=UPI000899F34F|nr:MULTISPECIES: CoA ester lyase [unclassified Beijerinckia]MDH7796646.1 citrate lyase subunit beta/citryl-CoA lyase [Beijerinckia sp. GAS462]SEC53998.1 citrate lyase subunit beta / citryl-CoA lyase [Beijerinckia sp. 28-YEA-48]
MIRSLLYVPGNSEKFIAKAHERDADAIILDLEDAVPAAEKAGARQRLAQSIASVGQNGATVFVRVNAAETGLQEDDAAAACLAGAHGILVPKASKPQMLQALDHHLSRIERAMARTDPVRLVPIVEDPGSVLNASAIATATARNWGLITGGEDLATSMNASPTPDMLRWPKLMVHFAAKAAGLRSLGLLRSVADFRDVDAVMAATLEARQHGFDGATCVHPNVVSLLNRGFFPTRAEFEWAREVVVAYAHAEQAGLGATTVQGRMVDLPVVERARRILQVKQTSVQTA